MVYTHGMVKQAIKVLIIAGTLTVGGMFAMTTISDGADKPLPNVVIERNQEDAADNLVAPIDEQPPEAQSPQTSTPDTQTSPQEPPQPCPDNMQVLKARHDRYLADYEYSWSILQQKGAVDENRFAEVFNRENISLWVGYQEYQSLKQQNPNC